MTDYESEYERLFSNGCKVSGHDWTKERYFDPNSNCYGAETALFSSLTSEAYTTYGVKAIYYIKRISTNRDSLFGEDPLELFERYFKLNMYMESTPTLQKTYEIQGMSFEEFVHIFASIEHFSEASRYDENQKSIIYDSYLPKIGDVIQFTFNEIYYEVINVKKYASGSTFMTVPLTYEFVLRQWKNDHEDTKTDMPIGDVSNLAKVFNISNETVNSSGDILSVNETVSTKNQVNSDNNPEIIIKKDNQVNSESDIMSDFD